MEGEEGEEILVGKRSKKKEKKRKEKKRKEKKRKEKRKEPAGLKEKKTLSYFCFEVLSTTHVTISGLANASKGFTLPKS